MSFTCPTFIPLPLTRGCHAIIFSTKQAFLSPVTSGESFSLTHDSGRGSVTSQLCFDTWHIFYWMLSKCCPSFACSNLDQRNTAGDKILLQTALEALCLLKNSSGLGCRGCNPVTVYIGVCGYLWVHMCDFEWEHSDESKWLWQAAVQKSRAIIIK